jgi:hypothetical protein
MRNKKGQFTSTHYAGIKLLLITTTLSAVSYVYGWTQSSSTWTYTPQAQAQEPEPTPEPTPEPFTIEGYITQVFGDKADEALKIAMCESRMNPENVGDKHLMVVNQQTGEIVGDSIGVYQIRTGGAGWNRAKANGMTADEFRVKLKQPKYNIDYAYEIYQRRGWSAWHNCKIKLGL